MPIALKPARMLGVYIRCKRAAHLHPPRVYFGKKRHDSDIIRDIALGLYGRP